MLRFLISRRADIFCHSLPSLEVVILHEKSVGKYHEELTRDLSALGQKIKNADDVERTASAEEFLTAQEKKAVDLMDSFKAQT